MSTLHLKPSAHEDSFTRDNLPPKELWPDMVFDLPELQYPDQLNVVSELLDNAVEEGYGDKIALYSSMGNLTYWQLQGYANQIANLLVEMTGFKPGNRVLLRGPNAPGLAVCWLAVLKAGGVVVTTMPMLRAGELTKIIKKAEISHALCLPNMTDELLEAQGDCPTLKHIIPLDGKTEFETFMGSLTKKFETVKTSSDDVAILAFTSGTTGEPKACMHFHRDIMSMVHTFSNGVVKPSEHDVFAGSPPLAFTYGLGGMLVFPLAARASTVLEMKPGAESLLEQIETFKVTSLYTAPTAYRSMLGMMEGRDISSLHTCISAGETLPKAVFDAWKTATGIELIDGIGATELFHIFISAEKGKVVPGSTGVPVPGFEVCILGPNNEPLGDNIVGRLAVKGPTGCRYLADDRQKDYVINGWNVTGDAYIRDENGHYWFQARTDDIILSGGYNIAGPEVENALLTHPAILEAAVVGWPDELRGNIVKAFCVINEGYDPSDILKGDLQNHVKQKIAPFKYPRAIEFIAELPKTQTGKVQRFKLQNKE